jgi:hypothetical protein
MKVQFVLIVGALALTTLASKAQDLGQCTTMQGNATRSCQKLSPDERGNCIEKVNEAVSRCIKNAKNYNGIGPANQPRGGTIQ